MGVIEFTGWVGCSRLARTELPCQLFIYGLHEFRQVEGFLEHAASAEEFGDVEEIFIALGTGHGNDLGVEVLAGQLKRGFETIRVRHEDIHHHEIDLVFLVGLQAFTAIGGLNDAMACFFQYILEQGADRFFIVDDKYRGHRAVPTQVCVNLTYVGSACLGRNE